MAIREIAILLITAIVVISIEVPVISHKYEFRRPLRYQYYRLNVKAQINPLISHLANPQNSKICSSKLGPFCELGTHQNFQQYKLVFDQYNQIQKSYYYTQKYYLPQRRNLANKINAGEIDVFMIPSAQYQKIDELVKDNIKSFMHQQQLQLPTEEDRKERYEKKLKEREQAIRKQQQANAQAQNNAQTQAQNNARAQQSAKAQAQANNAQQETARKKAQQGAQRAQQAARNRNTNNIK